MDLLFLSCAYSDTQKDIFMKASKRGYQFAAQNLQEALIEGFLQNDVNLTVLSVPSLSSYPKACSLFRIKEESFLLKGQKCGSTVGYLNLPIIKSWNKRSVKHRLEKWYANAGERKVIFIYALLKNQMRIALDFKKKHPDVKLAVIVPDLPRFMGYNRFLKLMGFQKRNIDAIYGMIHMFDAYVVLTKPMIDDLNIQDKKSIVVEGVYSASCENVIVNKREGKIILYTGGLSLRYGIGDLLDAFMQIKKPDYLLWICGGGDAVPYIKECAKKDSRIHYFGMLPQNKIKELQQEATILVNPRHSNEEFTRFSFPSKTMEYLASGTPTLMSHLECLPAEYDEHLYYFDDETVSGMASKMVEICETPVDELKEKGRKASEFIIGKKNPRKQVKRIVELFDKL